MRLARILLTGLILTCSWACRDGPAPARSDITSLPKDSLFAMDTVGCAADTVFAHADPGKLVQEYLQRDGSGAFLKADPWLNSALECPSHSPGWDAATLVTSFQTLPITVTTDSATFMVTYGRHSYLVQDSRGFFLNPSPAAESDTFVLIRSSHGWRIRWPLQEPHLLPPAALRLHLQPTDSLGVVRLTKSTGKH